jgi:hypothetical protein
MLHVAAAHGLHQLADTPCPRRRHQQVDVIRHQDVRVHRTLVTLTGFSYTLEVEAIVLIAEERSTPVNTSLDHVLRLTGEKVPWLTRHPWLLAGRSLPRRRFHGPDYSPSFNGV